MSTSAPQMPVKIITALWFSILAAGFSPIQSQKWQEKRGAALSRGPSPARWPPRHDNPHRLWWWRWWQQHADRFSQDCLISTRRRNASRPPEIRTFCKNYKVGKTSQRLLFWFQLKSTKERQAEERWLPSVSSHAQMYRRQWLTRIPIL